MLIQDLHYDLKQKLNKVDAQQYRNLLIPEIDWVLNEAMMIYIKRIALPIKSTGWGFEVNQRSIDNIRTLVVTPTSDPNAFITVVNNVASLPDNYLQYLKAHVIANKDKCDDVKCLLHIRQHDDEFEDSEFYKSSFEWREVNGTFFEKGIQLYTSDFNVTKLHLTYLRKPVYIHNAQDYRNGSYKIGNTLLSGREECELPEITHQEIVDIAAAIIKGETNAPDYKQILNKLTFTDLT